MNTLRKPFIAVLFFLLLLVLGCETKPPDENDDNDNNNQTHPFIDRESLIPEDAVKMTPETDHHPPVLHSDEFEDPVPLPYPVNTAGLEDAPYITEDGKTLYFFFTPNPAMDYQAQLLDGVTGIYVSHLIDDDWTVPERVWLQEVGKLALDGCPAVQSNVMWFCSAREGYTGVRMFTAQFIAGEWTDIEYVGDKLMEDYQLGEVHPHGKDLYFHSDLEGSIGGRDIWMITRENGTWSEPVNIDIVNTEADESLPFVTYDGQELWFTRTYQGTPGLFRSQMGPNGWEEPELILSMFAGEPTLDGDGNLYFVHHFFEDGVMIEADIYVAMRKASAYHHVNTFESPTLIAVLEPKIRFKK